MAVDVLTLLSLPKSAAFSKFREGDRGNVAPSVPTRSESPPRKTRRLAADSDSASASRSRAAANDRAGEKKGPIVITLHGPAGACSYAASRAHNLRAIAGVGGPHSAARRGSARSGAERSVGFHVSPLLVSRVRAWTCTNRVRIPGRAGVVEFLRSPAG